MPEKTEYQWESLMKMIEGMILRVLDDVSISGKWLNRNISKKRLDEKRLLLLEFGRFFQDSKWDIWLDIYCEHFSRNRNTIKRKFESVRKRSLKYVNKQLKLLHETQRVSEEKPESNTEGLR